MYHPLTTASLVEWVPRCPRASIFGKPSHRHTPSYAPNHNDGSYGDKNGHMQQIIDTITFSTQSLPVNSQSMQYYKQGSCH